MTDNEFKYAVIINNLVRALEETRECSKEELWKYLETEVGLKKSEYDEMERQLDLVSFKNDPD